MAERAYRNTRTGGIRKSSTLLGYPYVPVTAAEAKKADDDQGDAQDKKPSPAKKAKS